MTVNGGDQTTTSTGPHDMDVDYKISVAREVGLIYVLMERQVCTFGMHAV